MKLRPHHLMCIQSYVGKGYDEDFVKVMDKITYELRNNKEYLINIVFSTDDICVACPNMLDRKSVV